MVLASDYNSRCTPASPRRTLKWSFIELLERTCKIKGSVSTMGLLHIYLAIWQRDTRKAHRPFLSMSFMLSGLQALLVTQKRLQWLTRGDDKTRCSGKPEASCSLVILENVWQQSRMRQHDLVACDQSIRAALPCCVLFLQTWSTWHFCRRTQRPFISLPTAAILKTS